MSVRATVESLADSDITVSYEDINGEMLYVAKIRGLDDVTEYADSEQFARELAQDTINVMKELAAEGRFDNT